MVYERFERVLAEQGYVTNLRLVQGELELMVYGRNVRKGGHTYRNRWRRARQFFFDGEYNLMRMYPFLRCTWLLWKLRHELR